MTRKRIIYDQRTAPVRGEGYNVGTPTAGYYRHKLRSGCVFGAVRIWYGPPHDPVTGEELDRSWRWQATFNAEPVDIDRVWPDCGRFPIDEREAARLTQQHTWARQNAPDSGYADPMRRLDPLSTSNPLPF